MNLSIFGSRKDLARTIPQDGEQLIALFGSTELDLSHVALPESLRISGLSMFGSIKVLVPRGTEVVFRGFALFGSQEFKGRREGAIEDVRSILYMNAVAVFGSVEVIEVDR